MSWPLVAPAGNISPGVLLAFWGLGRGGEQHVLFLAWHPARSGAEECLHPTAVVLWHTSSTPKPDRSGLESRPGTAGEVEAFWTVLGYAGLVSAASQGAALATSCPFSPGRSMKPSLFLFAFKDDWEGCSV